MFAFLLAQESRLFCAWSCAVFLLGKRDRGIFSALPLLRQ